MASKTEVEAASSKASESIDKSVLKVQEAAETAVQQIQGTLDRLADLAGRGVSSGAEKAGHAAQKVVSGAEAVSEHGQAAVDSVLAQVEECAGGVTRFVRKNPAQSVLIALAAGWVAGRLMRR